MPTKINTQSTSVAAGLKAVAVALDDIAKANKELEARENRVQAAIAKLLRLAQKSGDEQTMLKLQQTLQRESQILTAIMNVLKARRDTAKAAIGNVL